MALWTASETLGLLAHALHYGIIVFGLVGIVVLLLPQRLHRKRTASRPAPRDAHEQRVAELRASLGVAAAGGASTGGVATTSTVVTGPPVQPPAKMTGQVSRTLLPLAVVSSAAAAGVHAAMGPSHFEEGFLLGLFFAGSAMAQLAWASLGLTSGGHRLLTAGVLLNAGCVLLWAVTRTLGLPFGLIPGPEAVGSWDVATVLWELVVVVCCASLLRRTPHAHAAGWEDWTRAPRLWLVASVVLLGLLSFTAGWS